MNALGFGFGIQRDERIAGLYLLTDDDMHFLDHALLLKEKLLHVRHHRSRVHRNTGNIANERFDGVHLHARRFKQFGRFLSQCAGSAQSQEQPYANPFFHGLPPYLMTTLSPSSRPLRISVRALMVMPGSTYL